MKKSQQLVAILGLITLGTGCASTRGYFVDRRRDASDTVTLCVEEKGLNVAARVGPLTAGIGAQVGKGFGLRSGALGRYRQGELQTILTGSVLLEPSEFDKSRGKGFELECSTFLPFSPYDEGLKDGKWHNHFQIELTACVGVGIRAGVNLAEILDFLLGWFTIDICSDDLEKRKSNKRLEDIGSNAPNPQP